MKEIKMDMYRGITMKVVRALLAASFLVAFLVMLAAPAWAQYPPTPPPTVAPTTVAPPGVGDGGGAAFTGTTLNVPVWMALVAALLVSGLLLVVLGGRRRRSVRARP